jgi:Asp/Glu/hydantoin racemase
MFDAAFTKGLKLAMLATFIPSIESMEKEFSESAPQGASLKTTFVSGAREAAANGNQAFHDQLIAETAATLKGYDAIMLAHFSMSTALELCKEVTDIPILAAPESAVRKLKRAVPG